MVSGIKDTPYTEGVRQRGTEEDMYFDQRGRTLQDGENFIVRSFVMGRPNFSPNILRVIMSRGKGVTTCSRVLLEKLASPQLVKKFSHFMEPGGSSRHSQKRATSPYPEPDQ